MTTKTKIIIGITALIGISLLSMSDKLHKIVAESKIRISDAFGSGIFGASRRKWTGSKYVTYKHQGIDIIVKPGENILSPITGKINRIAYPSDDHTWKGIEIENEKYIIKIFYVSPTKTSGQITAGEKIAVAQDISQKYNTATQKMTPHAHIEVRDKKTNKLLNPTSFFS
jgi:hypothetical protein